MVKVLLPPTYNRPPDLAIDVVKLSHGHPTSHARHRVPGVRTLCGMATPTGTIVFGGPWVSCGTCARILIHHGYIPDDQDHRRP